MFDAAIGDFIDSTAQITGAMQYVIKRQGRTAELVSYDAATHVARVYSSFDPTPQGLTCSYIADGNLLRLDWIPVLGASDYRVYSSPTAGTIETLEAIVSAPEHSVELPIQAIKRFYCVTADYSAR